MPKTDRDVLIEIGNLIGAPTMSYAPDYALKEWRERGEKVARLIQEQLGIKTPPVDPDKFRENPSGTRAVHALIRGSNWG